MKRCFYTLLFGLFALLTNAVAQPSFILHTRYPGYLIVEAPYGGTGQTSVVVQANTAEQISISGLDEDDFVISPMSFSLNAGDTASVTITYTPDGYNSAYDTVYFDGVSGRTALVIVGSIDTTRIPDRINVVDRLDFGLVDRATQQRELMIYSRVSDDVTVSLKMNDGPFYITQSSVTIPGMRSTGRSTVTVYYDGSAEESATSTLSIEDGGAPSGVSKTYNVLITGQIDTSSSENVVFAQHTYNVTLHDTDMSVTFPVHILNNTDQPVSDITLSLLGPHASNFISSPTTIASIGAGDTAEVTITVYRHNDVQQLTAILFAAYRTIEDDSLSTVTYLKAVQDLQDEAPRIIPDFHHFGSNTTVGDTRRAHFAVVNHTQDTVFVSQIESTSEDADIILYSPVLPVILYPSDSISIDLECTTTGTGTITGSLIAYCSKDGFVTSDILAVANYICGDTAAQRPVEVHISTSTPTPTTVDAHLRTLTPVPDAVTACVVSVEYDASVIMPLSTREGDDGTHNNLTTSHFRLQSPGHRPGSLLGSISFTRTSAGASPVTVTNIAWFDANGEVVDLLTKGNGTTVNVLEGGERGFSVAPLPLTDVVTVSYPEMATSGTLEIVNVAGAVVHRSNVAAGTTATAITTSSLPSGVYVVTLRTPNGILRKLVVR